MDNAQLIAFTDELEKISGWFRSGKKPVGAAKLIGAHKMKAKGKFKKALLVKEGSIRVERVGRQHHEMELNIPMLRKMSQFYAPSQPFTAGSLAIDNAALAKKRKGDVPSKEDMNALPKREDGRESATTVYGLGQQTSNIGTSLTPTGEHNI